MSKNIQKKRVWEIDAFRGLLIVSMLAMHMYLTVDAFCIDGYYNIDSYAWVDRFDPKHIWFDWGPDGHIYRSILPIQVVAELNYFAVACFFLISGICSNFTHNNLNRVVRLMVAAYFISAVSFVYYKWSGEETRFIRFGAIHCYAYCQLIYSLFLDKKHNKTLVILAIPILIIGYYLKFNPVHSGYSFLYPLGIRENGVNNIEYFPIMPFLGWILLGVVLGRKFYSTPKSICSCPLAEKLTKPLQWVGRNSGAIYLVHIIAYPAIFATIGYILHILD